ncbi:Asp/Glu racemase [Ancylobacter sp. SL191]|uniref:maleate cis-trans isomerase family protein n=1 Tax=Ancylobacter sp. SL191 TaxID=2995166 RepID=UPI00227069A6|nr:Asp/Glu racemase [Ancylobacter sp. SL191]WAC26244.1 Asp/Glu racemase [Ancylobacter sp. SL191]
MTPHAALASPAILDAPRDLGVMASELAPRLGARATIGLVVLATDQTIEYEFRNLLDLPGVGLYEARLHNDAEITPETLRAIGPRIAPSAELILPGTPVDVVAFGCTSATMLLGEDYVFSEIRKARPGVACTTPVTAARAALKALGARRIAMLTPYAPEITAGMAASFLSQGFGVEAYATFDRRDDRDAACISVDSIVAGAERLAREAPGIEAIFVSCTSLRVAEVVTRIEAATGVPVTSSNHAMAWHALRLAGIDDVTADSGRLFTFAMA